jgi:hypothetical protein
MQEPECTAEAQNRPSLAQEFKAARPTCLGCGGKDAG